MKNFRKGILFFISGAFFAAVSLSHASTVEENKAAANYNETLLPPGEEPAEEDQPSESETVEKERTAVSAAAKAMPASQAPAVIRKIPTAPAAAPVQTVSAPVRVIAPASSQAVASAKPSSQAASAPETKTATISSTVPVTAPRAPAAVTPAPAVSAPAPKDLPGDQASASPNPSGLIEISGYKYPVYLYAPPDYQLDRTYAMIMIAPSEDAKAQQQIEYLAVLAQRKSIFILAPYVLWPKEGDTPYHLDTWLLTVKKDVMERYPIDAKRVFLIGKDSGAHYAAYMAVKYPKEFSAVALLGEAWAGPFSQLVQPRSDATEQVPFYIALKAGGDADARNQVWFDTLQKKGYPLHLVHFETPEELMTIDYKKGVFDWMEETSQSWRATVAQGQKHWKAKFKKGVKDFFAV